MSVTPYDFTKPIRLPADWLHRLTGWFESACTLANRNWAKQLPTPLELAVAPLDTSYVQNVLPNLPASVIGYRVQIAGGQLPTLLTLPRVLLLQVIGIMLGEDGKTVPEDRELSLVEENLADYFLVNLWLPFFRESWPGARIVTWELGEREPAPQRTRFFPPGEVLLILPWQLKGPWGVSEGFWFMQKKGVLEALGDGQAGAPAPLDERILAQRKQALVSTLPVRLEFTLGRTELTLSQLSRLQVGDVMLLDQGNDDGIVGGAGSHRLFRGQVGRVGSWKAFKIEAFLQK